MLITNSRLKYVLCKLAHGAYQLADTARIHPARECALRALQRSVEYIKRIMPDVLGFDSQREAIDYSLRAVVDGHYLEFGVFIGGIIRYITRCIGQRSICGFDSFEGLSWSGFGLGSRSFDVKGRQPRMPDNVRLYEGLFEESLPQWLAENPGLVAFIHIDCNLYSSTKAILDLTAPRLVQGTDFVFDEYFNYPNWEQHVIKAFQEFFGAHKVKNTYLAFARQQAAVRIDSIGTGD